LTAVTLDLGLAERTLEMWTPIERWTPEHWMHIRRPRLIDIQSGSERTPHTHTHPRTQPR
jgi:hypothetical protein